MVNSVLVLNELSVGFDTAGGSLFLKHLCTSLLDITLLLLLLFFLLPSSSSSFSFIPPPLPFSLVTPSRNLCWVPHIPKILTLVCPKVQCSAPFSSLFTFPSTVIFCGLKTVNTFYPQHLSLYLQPRPEDIKVAYLASPLG